MWDSLVRVSSWVKIVRTLNTCWTFGSVFRSSNEKRTNSFFCLPLSGSVGLVVGTWRHKRGQDTRNNRHVRQQRDGEMMVVAIFLGRVEGSINSVQRRTPGAMRCTATSWTSQVRMLEPAAYQLRLKWCAWHGASSSSSDASAMVHSTGSSGACSSWTWSAAGSSTTSLKWATLWARS